MKLFIIGSCVSRDPFTLVPGHQHTIVEYCARNSFASAFRPERFPLSIDMLDPNKVVSSAWQRRMMEYDINRSLPGILEEKKNGVDAVLIDFIDERFALARSGDEYATYSVSFQECARHMNLPLVRSATDEHFELWRKGFSTFARQMASSGMPVYVNKVFWGHTDGQKKLYNPKHHLVANQYLEKLYKAAEDLGVLPLTYASEAFLIDNDHKWGLAPFHYQQPVYEDFMSTLDHIELAAGHKPTNSVGQ